MNENTTRLDKAESLAHWSYLGLVIPLIGWILASNSSGILRTVERTTSNTRRMVNIRSHLLLSIALSFLVVLFYAAILVSSLNSTARVQNVPMQCWSPQRGFYYSPRCD